MSGATGMGTDLNRDERDWTPQTATMLLAAGTVLALFVWMFWSFLQRQVRFAIEQQADWGHTLVIPFIAGWFVWLNRDKILSSPLRPSITGIVLLIAGAGWFAYCSLGPVLVRHHNLMGAGVGLAIFGLVLALCGWRAMRWMWFPTLYLIVFSQTVSDRFLEIITFQLQGIATVGGEIGLSLIGYDVARQGHTLDIFWDGKTLPLNIAEACSGMRMLVAFLALGVAMAYRGLDTVWQRVVLVFMAIPTAIFVNILRVMTLGILATQDSNFAAGDFHSMVGLLWLVPAFFIYLGIMWVLRQLVISDEDEGAQSDSHALAVRFDSKVIGVFVVCVVVLAASRVCFSFGANMLQVHLATEPVPLRRTLSRLPTQVGPWRSIQDVQFDASMIEELGTSSYLTRHFVADPSSGRFPVNLHIAYYTDQIDAVPHVPDRCMTAAGLSQRTPTPENRPIEGVASNWVPGQEQLDGILFPLGQMKDRLTGDSLSIRMPVGPPLIRHMEFVDPANPDRRIHAGYFFIANGRWRPSPGGVKAVAFTGGDRHAYYCKVQLVIEGDSGYSTDRFLDDVEHFLSPMLPEVMRSLPDWYEVELIGALSAPDKG